MHQQTPTSNQPIPPRQPDDWSKRKTVVLITLIALLLTAISGLLLVPPAWWGIPEVRDWFKREPQPALPPTQQPQPSPAPPVTNPPPRQDLQDDTAICGKWQSLTSGKFYNFSCQGQGSFEMLELNAKKESVRVGFGRIYQGNVDINYISPDIHRTATFTLRLSADGQTLEGVMQGEDVRETGRLLFRKVNQ